MPHQAVLSPERRLLVALAVLLLTVVALPLSACGDSASKSGQTQASTSEPAGPDVQQVGSELLGEWSELLVPTLLTARDRAEAARAGQTAKASGLERKLRRQLERVQRFGRDARKALLDVPASPEKDAVKAAGDAWTEWAYELLTDAPAGDFDQARKIADLATEALRLHLKAYEAIGENPPVEFQRPNR